MPPSGILGNCTYTVQIYMQTEHSYTYIFGKKKDSTSRYSLLASNLDLENQWGEINSFSYVSVHRSNVKSIVKTWSVQSSMRTLNTITVVLLYTEIGSRVLWSKPPIHWENVSLSLLIKCRLTDS